MAIYIIIERLGHLPDGIVPHDVVKDDATISEGISYPEARELLQGILNPDDTVIERYESTGTEVCALGHLP